MFGCVVPVNRGCSGVSPASTTQHQASQSNFQMFHRASGQHRTPRPAIQMRLMSSSPTAARLWAGKPLTGLEMN